MNPTTHTFHVHGMHCKSCTILIEETFVAEPHIDRAEVSLSGEQVSITGVFTGTPEMVAEELSALIRQHGYTVSLEKKSTRNFSDFVYALPLALVILGIFVLLQKAGFTSLISGSSVSYGTAFVVGLIASVSSCIAIVGGLVLSLSANSAKEGGTWKTQSLFHVGRIGGFFILGGLVGVAGSSLHLGLTANIVLGFFVALVMLILGLNLLDTFSFTKRLLPALPASFSRRISAGSTENHYLAPALVGIGTFFLPCGFTQSMQLYALSTGNFMQGALTMAVFALGTFPVLALISFGSFSIAHKPWKGIFFKTSGIVVIILALFTASNTLKLLTPPKANSVEIPAAPPLTSQKVQFVDITAKGGYSPRSVTAKAGVPTILRITTNGTFDCSSSIVIPQLSYQKFLKPSGTEEIAISADQARGTLRGTCAMGMYSFSITFE